jgi:hypothetical protein
MVGLGIVEDHIKALKERYAQIGIARNLLLAGGL